MKGRGDGESRDRRAEEEIGRIREGENGYAEGTC